MKDMLTVATLVTDKNYDEFEENMPGLINTIMSMSDEEDHLSELLIILNNETRQYEETIRENVLNVTTLRETPFQEELKDKLANISVKIVKTHKLSKDYALCNLAWQAGSGDIVVFHESSSVLRKELRCIISSFENNTHANGAFIYYNMQTDFQQATISPNRSRLYKDINYSYLNERDTKQILPLSARGWVANRKMINDAFASQSEHYEPYIALAISGLEKINIAVDANEYSYRRVDYKKSHREELRAMYVSQRQNKFTSLISKLTILSSLISLFLVLSHFDMMSWSPSKTFSVTAMVILIILVCMIVVSFSHHLRDMLIIQKQTLAASLNKSVVGQFEIHKVI